MLHTDLTEVILKAFYTVYNTLGYSFLEKIYENALLLELRRRGLRVHQQVPIKVYYAGQVVGEYFADLLVEDKVTKVTPKIRAYPSHPRHPWSIRGVSWKVSSPVWKPAPENAARCCA
ncbi:MAG TPA: GxxExxY protein [Anaerolineaceae bacterium]|nr:GxxExxY protein [Anaerolineales bacterium]HIQ09751.1 GxxExxY protein [Anaerolineaceae bacterium]